MEVHEPHILYTYAVWMCLQAKVQEPELYELHDRVTQIRKEMKSAPDGKDLAMQNNMAQNGVATQ